MATAGARPKITNRMASGTHESTVFRAIDHMVSKGKHSRGNWVLANRALLLSNELPPVPRELEKKLQQRCPRMRRGHRGRRRVGNPFTRENTTMKITRVATGASTAQSTPSVACLYWARKSGSASVYMMSRLAHSSRIDSMKRTLWWYQISSGGSSGMVDTSVTCSESLPEELGAPTVVADSTGTTSTIDGTTPLRPHRGPLTVNGTPIDATPGGKDTGKPRPSFISGTVASLGGWRGERWRIGPGTVPAVDQGTSPVVAQHLRILQVIKCMGYGGAEKLLVDMVATATTRSFEYEVAYVLSAEDALVPAIREGGTPVHPLGARGNADRPGWADCAPSSSTEIFDVVHFHLPYTGHSAVWSWPPFRGLVGRRSCTPSTASGTRWRC